jgi:hypothetical protein
MCPVLRGGVETIGVGQARALMTARVLCDVRVMAKAKTATKAKPTAKAKAAPKVSVRDLSRDVTRVKKLIAAAKLPGVEEGLSYGMPSLKVAGKFMARVREPDVLVVMCDLEEKEFLMQMNGAIYFETDHYKGWPAVLVRLSKIDDAALTHRLQVAWRRQAPKKLQASIANGGAAAKPARATRK